MFLVGQTLKKSYNFYLSKLIPLVGITAIVYIFRILLEYISSETYRYSTILAIVLSVVLAVILIIVEIGYLKFLLKFTSGTGADASDLLSHTNLFWRYIFAVILYGLVVLLGLVLLIIPGIYLAIRFAFVPIILIDKEIGIKEAFRRSTEITKGYKWKILGFFIIIGFIQAIIGLAYSIDSSMTIYAALNVLFMPFISLSVIYAYRSLSGLDS